MDTSITARATTLTQAKTELKPLWLKKKGKAALIRSRRHTRNYAQIRAKAVLVVHAQTRLPPILRRLCAWQRLLLQEQLAWFRSCVVESVNLVLHLYPGPALAAGGS